MVCVKCPCCFFALYILLFASLVHCFRLIFLRLTLGAPHVASSRSLRSCGVFNFIECSAGLACSSVAESLGECESKALPSLPARMLESPSGARCPGTEGGRGAEWCSRVLTSDSCCLLAATAGTRSRLRFKFNFCLSEYVSRILSGGGSS